MRKQLLTAMLGLVSASSLMVPASAEGLLVVGANVIIAPSSQYDGDKEWSATTWVYNTGIRFGEGQTQNPLFNIVAGTPATDANGHEWYEVAYDTATVGAKEEMDEVIKWEDHTAPFSSDENYNGRPSYRWATNDVMAEIYFRRFFITDKLLSGDVYLACGHDDAPCEYYLNGVLVFSKTGFEVDHYIYNEETGEVIDSVLLDGWNNNEYVKLTDEQKALIKLGGEQNLLAVHVHQNWGGAFADCGLYTSVPGGLDMGYVTPWTGKVLFNSWGGYRDPDRHDWEKLYEAQPGDKYTIHLLGQNAGEWGQQVHFRTPIRLSEEKEYTLKLNLETTQTIENVTIKVTETDKDDVVAALENVRIEAGEVAEQEIAISGVAVENMNLVLNFATEVKGTDVTLSGISLFDETEEKEIWVGTSYFNYCYVTDVDTITNEEDLSHRFDTVQIKDPVIDGRVETMSWTDPDFDDSMWSEQAMPMGNAGYMPELQSIWPGQMGHLDYTGDGDEGQNTNYWVRRTFTLDKVNERLSYALNVCHDDTYWTYINGHLLQNYDGWTDGKNPKQVHIPARYLREGKNVIATYIRQNWGGRFYDCGINVEEVNYDDCADELKAAIALGQTDTILTKAMRLQLDSLVAAGQKELETNKDAAEVKEYAKNLTASINTILGYAGDVKTLLQTIDICGKTEDKGYMKEALEAVTAGVDTCVNNSQTNSLLSTLRLARKRNALERHTEKYVGSQPAAYDNDASIGDNAEGAYYIYNVGERLFLTGAEDWGAHLGLAYMSNAFHLINVNRNGEPLERGYRIETMRPNGLAGVNDFINYGGYVDCDTDDAWEFKAVEGKTNVFNICRVSGNPEEGGVYMLGYRDGKDNRFSLSYNVVDTDMLTAESEANQWMLISKAELDALMLTATEENPVEATHLIKNPGFDQRLDDSYWWADIEGGTNDNGDSQYGLGIWGRGANHPDFAYEAWNCNTGSMTQEIFEEPGLIPGWYTLSAQIYYRDGRYEDHVAKYLAGETLTPNASLMAGEGDAMVTGPIAFITDCANQVPGWGRLDASGTVRMPDACSSATEEYFQNGLYWSEPLLFEVTEEASNVGVSFGFMKTGFTKYDWVVADNFRLKYYGKQKPTAIERIDEVVTPAQQGGAAIYNLQGQRLSRVQKGVNIIGGKKMLVK